MPVTLLENIEGENIVTKGRVFRNNLNLEALSPLTVSENEAEIRGSVSEFFPPAFSDDSIDVFFSFKKVGENEDPTEIFVNTFSDAQKDTVITREISGLERNTVYEYFVFGEIDGARVSSGTPRQFRTGVFTIATIESKDVGQEQATLVGEVDKFRSLVFEQSGPFNITSELNSGTVEYENVDESESPLFVLDAFTNPPDLRTVINTDDGELTLEGGTDISFPVSEQVTISVDKGRRFFDLTPETFSFQSQITKDINAGFEYKEVSETSYKTISSADSPEQAGDIFEAVPNLDPNSEYEFRAFGTIGSFERIYGEVQTFETLEKEIVELDTIGSEAVTATDATLNGTVNRIEPAGREVFVGFNYGSSSVTDNQTNLTPKSTFTDFSETLSGIDAFTTYEFQAVATGQSGDVYTGPIKTFTTEGVIAETVGQPTATEAPSKQPTEGTGFLFGEIIDLNPDSANADIEFEYGKEEPLNNVKTASGKSEADGEFDVTVEGLDAGEQYKYRLLATDPATGDTDSGSIKTFNTVEMGVATRSAESVGQTAATINGEVTTLKTSGSYTVKFEYKEEGADSFIQTSDQIISSGKVTFNENLSGLNEAQVYEYRAVIEKNTATVKGEIQTFQTKAVEISSLDASNVQTGSSQFNGELTFVSNKVSDVSVFFEYREQGSTNRIRKFADQSPVSSTGTFSTTVSGLFPSRTYEYQAVANPSEAQVERAENFKTFTTLNVEVTTANIPVSRTENSLTIEGELVAFEGDFNNTSVVVGHQYIRRGSGDITNSGIKVESSSSPLSSLSTFQTTIPDLNNGTKYDVRSFATVGGTTAFGKLQRVSTKLN